MLHVSNLVEMNVKSVPYKPRPASDMQLQIPFNSDKLYMLPRDKVMVAAFKVLDSIQTEPIEMQLAAISAAFVAYNKLLNRVGKDSWDMGERMMKREPHHIEANNQIDALTDFIAKKASGSI